MIKEIVSGDMIFAIIADASDCTEGIQPLTDSAWPLQALMRAHKKGHRVAAHAHKEVSRVTKRLHEGLVVISGTLRARIFDTKRKEIGVYDVLPGQCLLMLNGGHEIEVINDAVVYEFKNGPYVDDKIFY